MDLRHVCRTRHLRRKIVDLLEQRGEVNVLCRDDDEPVLVLRHDLELEGLPQFIEVQPWVNLKEERDVCRENGEVFLLPL